MFARLSKRLADIHWNGGSDGRGASGAEDFLPSDVQALSQLNIPIPQNALETAAGVCGKVFTPFYHYVGTTMCTDIEALVSSLHEADPAFADRSPVLNEDEDIYVIPFSPKENDTLSTVLQNKSAEASEVAFRCVQNSNVRCTGNDYERPPPRITSSSGSMTIPSIVITHAPPQLREMSSCVPVQDTSFGARLTVPTHSALNAAHPPMARPAFLHASVRMWTYRHGHWCAIAPALDEQEQCGIFSRPIGARRRAARARNAKRAAQVRDNAFPCQNVFGFGRKKRDS
ncbi:hypothetical protein DFH11DRAFT_1685408 [Phellopilus nigrolimitatus]|nr:hypothetical protein DFH11DRAFT_1685408 [Phellopilus nigrolimitatus]